MALENLVNGMRKGIKNLAYAGVVGLSFTGGVRGETITQLTHETSYEGQPAWSPDGNKIAFVSNRDGYIGIYIMNSDGTSIESLPHYKGNEDKPDCCIPLIFPNDTFFLFFIF